MTKKKKTEEEQRIALSLAQIEQLIRGAIPNVEEVMIATTSDTSFKFILILDPLYDEEKVPANCEKLHELEDEEYVDLVCAHGVAELFDFFEDTKIVEGPESEKPTLMIETCNIGLDLLPALLFSLDEITQRWIEVDADIALEEENKMRGLTIVKGNNTIQ